MLVSLKAGGLGLNLTAADTVIHLDPWWNPAGMAQATDRAHRLGQTKPVFVYQLVVAGSIEELLHETGKPAFYIPTHDGSPATAALEVVRLGRAIGVIYLPQTERQSHYFHVRPSDQFDAMIHIDSTRALEPLEPTSVWVAGQNPETYPTGL